MSNSLLWKFGTNQPIRISDFGSALFLSLVIGVLYYKLKQQYKEIVTIQPKCMTFQ